MCVEPPWERFETFKSRMGGDIPRLTSGQAVQELMVFSAGANAVAGRKNSGAIKR